MKKIREIIVAGNRGRGRPKKKRIKVIGEDKKAYVVYENMIRDRE